MRMTLQEMREECERLIKFRVFKTLFRNEEKAFALRRAAQLQEARIRWIEDDIIAASNLILHTENAPRNLFIEVPDDI